MSAFTSANRHYSDVTVAAMNICCWVEQTSDPVGLDFRVWVESECDAVALG